MVFKKGPSPSMSKSSTTTDATDADDADEEEKSRDDRSDNVEPKVGAHCKDKVVRFKINKNIQLNLLHLGMSQYSLRKS